MGQACRRCSQSEFPLAAMHCDWTVQVLVARHQPQLNAVSIERHRPQLDAMAGHLYTSTAITYPQSHSHSCVNIHYHSSMNIQYHHQPNPCPIGEILHSCGIPAYSLQTCCTGTVSFLFARCRYLCKFYGFCYANTAIK